MPSLGTVRYRDSDVQRVEGQQEDEGMQFPDRGDDRRLDLTMT
jgi:hypothetical protein